MNAELLPDEPSDLEAEPIEPNEASDLDFEDMPCTDDLLGDNDDDSRWEVFIPDEDERDPEPDSDDFLFENARTDNETRRLGDKDDVDRCLLVSPTPCLLA